MATGDKLTEQSIATAMATQDINLDITCYEADGTTLRDMTTGGWKLTFEAVAGTATVTKTSDAGEIAFGTPDNNSVRVTLTNADLDTLNNDYLVRWQLSGTDTVGDNEFVAAIGTWEVTSWL